MGEAMTPGGENVVLNWLARDAAILALSNHETLGWLLDGLAVADVGIPLADVLEAVSDGTLRLVLVKVANNPTAAVLLEIATAGEPPKKTLSVVAAGGSKMHAWLHDVQHALRLIAANEGCARVVVIGRPGWERALRQFGWKKTGAVMEIEPIAATRH